MMDPSLLSSLRLARGWNTWNTRSVLSHVLLPCGFSLNLGVKEYRDGAFLREALIGRQGANEERIRPGPHSSGGSLTSLVLSWRDIELRIESAHAGDDMVLLVTPLRSQRMPCVITAEAGFLWNRTGTVERLGTRMVGLSSEMEVTVHAEGDFREEPNIAAQGPYVAMALDGPCCFSTGRARTLDEVSAIIAAQHRNHAAQLQKRGTCSDLCDAIQTCMAWDTIYDPLNDRVISPVSRIWNVNHGGYVLFCWDTYFAAYLASLHDKDLAYANAIAITREITDEGFVPNFANPGMKSRDRSQPPVGSFVIRELYRRFRDRWLLEEVFDDLLKWNRWWWSNRRQDGWLCWGSNPYTPVVDNRWESEGVNGRFGAALESGLDNSPLYDGIPFNTDTHLLELADTGLNGLYALDCDCLADLARVLVRSDNVVELAKRGDETRQGLARLWSEEVGIFLNRRTDTGEFDHRLAPTHFYPLLAGAATQAQAERMIVEHFSNPQEFAGEWILPSIARNDPAYADQAYWRGRIWAPLNLLVYLGLLHYDLPEARRELAGKSAELLLKEWRECGHVHENYNANTGEGCDRTDSDRFYHWGGLLGLPALIEAGILESPHQPL